MKDFFRFVFFLLGQVLRAGAVYLVAIGIEAVVYPESSSPSTSLFWVLLVALGMMDALKMLAQKLWKVSKPFIIEAMRDAIAKHDLG